ncbi:MAG: carbamoyltransferase HypF [Acidimicrobiales bacterium]
MNGNVIRKRFVIEGVVQGVGFRPHVYRLAVVRGLTGHVGNDSTSVFVEAQGLPDDLDWFEHHVVADAPPLARVHNLRSERIETTVDRTFRIVESRSAGGARTLVSPDVAVCDHCVAEMLDPSDRRYRYPFITCTNCGPRFTIIRRLPYDRPNTTMAAFVLCETCDAQYHDPADRRFHAQPLACDDCGPHVSFESATERFDRSDDVIAAVQRDLIDGKIVAIKGLGGYHLACDATNDEAVALLRSRKGRVDKPFAVMASDLSAARAAATIDAHEAAALTSPSRPIVLVEAHSSRVSALVAPRNPRIGVMLPSTPLHHLLLRPVPGHERSVPQLLVMTSGNLSNEPLAYEDDDARDRLAALADSFCTNDRPIHVPCDDSVMRMIDGRELPIRRSRGYAPLPVALPIEVGPTLAAGGELKNTFCVASGRHAWMSQHIGDMENVETLVAFERSVDLFCDMYAIEPAVVAADMHPGYLTRQWADDRFEVVEPVQHHHAHIASLMAESGSTGDVPVIGVAFDGTGYGLDRTIWGGEFLVADYDGFERVAALSEIPLPGGDAAIRRPYRTALAHLWAAGIPWAPDLPPVETSDATERQALASMFERGTGCTPTSSMGRLFDAVASLLGVRHEVTYEGQAAIELEHLVDRHAVRVPRLRFTIGDDGRIGCGELLHDLVEHRRRAEAVALLATAFHDSVAHLVLDVARRIRIERGLNSVALTGGVFQNADLDRSTRVLLESDGFAVLVHRLVPPNDGGLALGQAIIAGRRTR